MHNHTGGKVSSIVFFFLFGLIILSVILISTSTNKNTSMTLQSRADAHCVPAGSCVSGTGCCISSTKGIDSTCSTSYRCFANRTPTPLRTRTPTLVTCVSTGSCEVSGRACCSGTKRYDLSCFATHYRCTPRPSATPTIFRTKTPTPYRSRTPTPACRPNGSCLGNSTARCCSGGTTYDPACGTVPVRCVVYRSPTPNPCIHVDLDECRARCPGGVCTNTGCSAGRYKCGSIVPTNTPTQSTSGCGAPLLPYAAVGQGGFQLSSNFVPPNLVNAQSALPDVIVRNGNTEKVTRNAVAPIKRLSDLAKSKGYKLVILDGYRSYQEQEQIHNENPDGSAPPGQSAHQLGVSLDVELEDSTGRRIALTNDIIEKVDELGMLHPLATDRPHIFVLEGTVANSAAIINNLQSQINSGQSYYLQMNQQIIQQQINCGINN